MTTYLQTAMYQRLTKISPNAFEAARQISAQQFRPKETTDGISKREPEPEHSDGR